MSYLPLPQLSREIALKRSRKKTGNLMLDYYNEINVTK